MPEIPSAQQIAKDGLNLDEMNKLLLKKVEELTFYLIEKDKELSAQKVELLSQQKQLNLKLKQISAILKKIKEMKFTVFLFFYLINLFFKLNI